MLVQVIGEKGESFLNHLRIPVSRIPFVVSESSALLSIAVCEAAFVFSSSPYVYNRCRRILYVGWSQTQGVALFRPVRQQNMKASFSSGVWHREACSIASSSSVSAYLSFLMGLI